MGYSLNLGWELPNQFIAHKWTGSDPQLWEKMEEFNDSAKESKAVGFCFDNTQYESQVAALANVVKQYTGSLNSGSADPETYLPELPWMIWRQPVLMRSYRQNRSSLTNGWKRINSYCSLSVRRCVDSNN